MPATIGLFETHACKGTKRSGEWMPSFDSSGCRWPKERRAKHFESVLSSECDPLTYSGVVVEEKKNT